MDNGTLLSWIRWCSLLEIPLSFPETGGTRATRPTEMGLIIISGINLVVMQAASNQII